MGKEPETVSNAHTFTSVTLDSLLQITRPAPLSIAQISQHWDAYNCYQGYSASTQAHMCHMNSENENGQIQTLTNDVDSLCHGLRAS